MKQNRPFIFAILLLLAVVAGCGERSELSAEQQPTATGVVTQEDEYWNGGEFAGRPVYSLSRGVSQVLHDDFEECLLEDDEIETAVQNFITHGSEQQVIVARLAQGETIWRKSITVTPITGDIYELSCSRSEPQT